MRQDDLPQITRPQHVSKWRCQRHLSMAIRTVISNKLGRACVVHARTVAVLEREISRYIPHNPFGRPSFGVALQRSQLRSRVAML